MRCLSSKMVMRRVLNSMAANRRLALRAMVFQAVVATGIALAFLLRDGSSFQAAAIGGGAVVLGTLLYAWRSLSMQVPSAGLALAGLITGIVLKWLVVLAALYVALARLGLPPLPLLAGAAGTTVAFLLISKIKS